MKKYGSKTTLFLMETVIAVFFFAVCSTICVQLFVKSYLISRSNTQLSQGLIQIQSAQAVLAKNDMEAAAQILNGQYLTDSHSIRVLCGENDSCVLIIEKIDEDNYILKYKQTDGEKEILSQRLTIHRPLSAKEAVK